MADEILTEKEVIKTLEGNPYFVQLVDILESRLDLQTRLSSGDDTVIAELEKLAFIRFWSMINDLQNNHPKMIEIRNTIAHIVFQRITGRE